jgi:hypothetical protein
VVDLYTRSDEDIVRIRRGGASPQRILVEGDSLGIACVTHSFYWPFDWNKIDDYEPLAVCERDRTCLSRVHYRTIVIWQGFTENQGRPVVYFTRLAHTPVICSRQRAAFREPSQAEDRWAIKQFLKVLKKMRSEDQGNYTVDAYSDRIVDEDVPTEDRFTWDKINNFILIAPATKIEDLSVSNHLRDELNSILMKMNAFSSA